MSKLVKIVVPKVAAHWEALAYCLGFESFSVDIIKQNHPNGAYMHMLNSVSSTG